MKVFISYAREDIETARKLYHDLKRAGITPWMDKEDILIGENWKIAIRQAIKESSYFIALLSSNSLSKQGYVQKELKMALNILAEMPVSGIFFLPIRLDDCHPFDEKLQDINWGDLFPSYDKGFQDILRVLSRQDAADIPDFQQKKEDVPEKKEAEVQPLKTESQWHKLTGEVMPVPKVKPTPQPQALKTKYQLRKEPITVSSKEALKAFNLKQDTDSWWRPLEYIQNDFRDNGDGTIIDLATDLMWQKSGSPKDINYGEAKVYIKKLNQEKFAGYRDWRLPTVDELKFLLTSEKQSNGLYINPIFGKNQSCFWTSDSRASGGVWRVDFSYGVVYWYFLGGKLYVRAVRSVK